MSALKETDLKICGTSGLQLTLPVRYTKYISLTGGVSKLHLESSKSKQKFTLTGTVSTMDFGRSLGTLSGVNISGSVQEWPSDGTKIYTGKHFKGKNQLRAIDLINWPVLILSGNIGSLTGASGTMIIWRGRCEGTWRERCECAGENLSSLLSGTYLKRILDTALAVGVSWGIERTAAPVGIGVSVGEGAFFNSTITSLGRGYL